VKDAWHVFTAKNHEDVNILFVHYCSEGLLANTLMLIYLRSEVGGEGEVKNRMYIYRGGKEGSMTQGSGLMVSRNGKVNFDTCKSAHNAQVLGRALESRQR
jgi:hypothetical protein